MSRDAGDTWTSLNGYLGDHQVAPSGWDVTAVLGELRLLVKSESGPLYELQVGADRIGSRELRTPEHWSFSQDGGAPRDRSAVIRFSPDFHQNQTVFAAADDTLVMSGDAGETWHPIAVGQQLQERSARIRWHGEFRSYKNPRALRGRLAASGAAPAGFDLRFRGRAVRWLCAKLPGGGQADVHLNGVFVARVELQSATVKHRQHCFESSRLPAGELLLQVRTRGGPITVDAIEIDP